MSTIGHLLTLSEIPTGSAGMNRLERIARHEWGTPLDREKLALLRDHLCRGVRVDRGPGAGSDVVDAMTLDEAADLLEKMLNCGDPGARLIDATRTTCLRCATSLDESDRACGRSTCHACRVGMGAILELDIAIRTLIKINHENPFYDFLASRFPDWPVYRAIIRDRFGVTRVDRDAWDAFRDWVMVDHRMTGNEFLAMKRTALLDLLRRNERYVTPPDSLDPKLPLPTPDEPKSEAPPALTVAEAIRVDRPRAGTQAAFLEFMEHRTRATFEEVARSVHGDVDTSPEAIRQNVSRVNGYLEEKEESLRFRCCSEHVTKQYAPE